MKDGWTGHSPGTKVPTPALSSWSLGTFHLLPGETGWCHLIQDHLGLMDEHLSPCGS